MDDNKIREIKCKAARRAELVAEAAEETAELVASAVDSAAEALRTTMMTETRVEEAIEDILEVEKYTPTETAFATAAARGTITAAKETAVLIEAAAAEIAEAACNSKITKEAAAEATGTAKEIVGLIAKADTWAKEAVRKAERTANILCAAAETARWAKITEETAIEEAARAAEEAVGETRDTAVLIERAWKWAAMTEKWTVLAEEEAAEAAAVDNK